MQEHREIVGKDGAPMVLIPAGEFEMGGDNFCYSRTKFHTVYIDAFYIDKYEVTNAQYKRFVQATNYKEPEGFGNGKWGEGFKPWQDKNFNGDNQPVVCVSWGDAKAYAEWAGKQLPTEAEWEKAAKGGLSHTKYIWGDKWPPPKGAGNFADETFKKVFPERPIINGYDDGYAYTSPVGSFDPNGYGLYDILGNVSEWCADWYDPNYYSYSPKENPNGPDSDCGCGRVLRGGPWCYFNFFDFLISSRSSGAQWHRFTLCGFRCIGL